MLESLNQRWIGNREGLEIRVKELMGLEELKRPLTIFIINEEERNGFILRKIRYNATPSQRIIRTSNGLEYVDYEGDDAKKRDNIFAYLLIPKGLTGKVPAILALHQHHGRFDLGKSEVIFEYIGDEDQKYALELVHRGYVVIAPDSIGFEERQLSHKNSKGPWGDRYLFFNELLHGRSLIGKNVSDNKRAIDVLTKLKEVDSERIGCIGHSLGGMQTFYTAALDKRVKAAVSNCGIATIPSIQEDHICHSFSFYIYGLLKDGIDAPEILSLINPRAFLISATMNDANFPIEGAIELIHLGKKYYKNSDNLQLKVFNGSHQFPKEARETAYKFLEEHL